MQVYLLVATGTAPLKLEGDNSVLHVLQELEADLRAQEENHETVEAQQKVPGPAAGSIRRAF